MTEIKEVDRQIRDKKVELENVKGTDCTVFTRVCGYYRATHNFNAGRAEEAKLRVKFDMGQSMINKEEKEKAKV